MTDRERHQNTTYNIIFPKQSINIYCIALSSIIIIIGLKIIHWSISIIIFFAYIAFIARSIIFEERLIDVFLF